MSHIILHRLKILHNTNPLRVSKYDPDLQSFSAPRLSKGLVSATILCLRYTKKIDRKESNNSYYVHKATFEVMKYEVIEIFNKMCLMARNPGI